MNRNTILAFLLILATIVVFNHPAYYKYVLHQEHPSEVAKRRQRERAFAEQQSHSAEAQPQGAGQAAAPVETAQMGEQEAATTEPADTSGIFVDTVRFDTIWVETEKLVVGISERGARIVSVKTKEYRRNPIDKNGSLEGNPYIELIDDPDAGGANLLINGENFDGRIFDCVAAGESLAVSGTDSLTVPFVLEDAGGNGVRKEFRFTGGSYLVGLKIKSATLNGKKVGVGWLGGIAESEGQSGKASAYDMRKVHLFDGKNVSHIAEKKAHKSEESGYFKWVGLTSKYFLTALVSDAVRDGDVELEAVALKDEAAGDATKKRVSLIDYRLMWQRFAAADTETYEIYVGPSSLRDLKAQGIKLEKVLFGGWKWFLRADLWFPALCEFVLWLLIFLQKGLHDYGLVIIVLTILSRLITYPLTQSSMKSMSRMRDLQPKVSAIRDKHKGNAQKMNQKMMELYKQEGVNPLNPGCLPMFLQMPVFISLFIVLRKAIELRGAGTWLVPWVHDLSQPEALPVVSDWLQRVAPNGLWMYGNTVGLLPVVMAVLTFYQNKLTMKDPNQKAMVYFMPVFMLVLFNSFPSGLVLYWTFSSALGLAQQVFTDKWKKLPKARNTHGARA
jgi:YidC/Oxa1 family membrane protein insertase